MSEITKTKTVTPKPKYVTSEEFASLVDVIGKLSDSVTALNNKTTELPKTALTKQEEEIAKAKHDQAPINPAWEDMAREILGEVMDHCEIYYPKAGGTLFTVVIKNEFSNAPKEYLERNRTDRRSKEIGNEGISGVESWCRLIKSNLKRTK